MQTTTIDGPTHVHHPVHAHHQLSAAIFVGSLILSAAMVLSAELTKPERYEFHPGASPTSYIIYDRDTGRATTAEFNAKKPLATLSD